MKQIASLLVSASVLVLVAGCSQNASSVATTASTAKAASDEIASLRATLHERDEELRHMGRGASLLLALNSQPDRYRTLTDFLATIDANELRCTIKELTEYPLVLYTFHQSYVLPDGSHRPVFDRKSGLVLVEAKTLSVIDYVVGTGYRTEGHATSEPWTTEWLHEDGRRVRYRILASGFEQIDDESP